jgi:hypothetical protein
LLEAFKAHHPAIRVHCIAADALYGTVSFVDEASAMCGGVQVLSQIRSHQNMRAGTRAQHVADSCATHPGTPHTIRIRGGEEVVVGGSSARLYVCAHKTKRFIVAITYAEEETYRSLIASDLSWRTLDIVQGHSLRGLVELRHWELKSGLSLGEHQVSGDTNRSEKSVGIAVLAYLLVLRVCHHEIVPGKPWSIFQLQHALRLRVMTNQVEHTVKVKIAKARKAA